MPSRVLFVIFVCLTPLPETAYGDFLSEVRPILEQHCVGCHSGETPAANANFEKIRSPADVVEHFDLLERGLERLQSGTMPPEGEDRPTEADVGRFQEWIDEYLARIVAAPAAHRPRRLSVHEYRNTLRTVLGFDLRVAVIEAEQTLSEPSMVIKLLPVDPPGASGFKNDTHRNRLTAVAWDQYAYLADAALDQLFDPNAPASLMEFVGPVEKTGLSAKQATRLLREFLRRTRRRPVPDDVARKSLDRIAGLEGPELLTALRVELKTILMSPAFLYRGLLARSENTGRQPVDQFELAERLSYFLWADMPDARLHKLAADGRLADPGVLEAEVDRMLAAPKARRLAEIFAVEWFSLEEIEHVSNNPPQMLALKSQPIDFMHYLFTEQRPLLELVDSDTAFVNPHTARMYGRDARQMTRYRKQKGIEVEAVPNQRIRLEETDSRGGMLTMPGILAMNKGPIQRGTWVLERILGEELPEPPPDVGQVQPNRRDEQLTFRQRFEQHRSRASCAVCHDKIDPLGFVLETYDPRGAFIRGPAYKPNKRDVRKGLVDATPNPGIDTSGRLPTGEEFDDISGLKQILRTSQRKAVIRSIVRRTMSYALCRRLMVYDRPTVESICKKMDESSGTWRDLFVAVVTSVPFTETMNGREP